MKPASNKRSPEGAVIPAAVQNNTGRTLQQLAWQNAQQYLTNFRPKTMGSCRQIMVNQVCPRYFTFTDRPEQISACVDWMDNTGFSPAPFIWPDPDLVIWPDP